MNKEKHKQGDNKAHYICSIFLSVLIRIGDKSEKKPVFQVELVPEEQLVVFISGKTWIIFLLLDRNFPFKVD